MQRFCRKVRFCLLVFFLVVGLIELSLDPELVLELDELIHQLANFAGVKVLRPIHLVKEACDPFESQALRKLEHFVVFVGLHFIQIFALDGGRQQLFDGFQSLLFA